MIGKAKILVVDDKENVRSLLRDILADRHDVVLAANGGEASRILTIDTFQLVITDVRMPGPDGFDLVRLVREKHCSIEVVMMTAFGSIPDAVEAIRRGAYDYLTKPFDPDDLLLVVGRALERQRERVMAPREDTQILASLSYRQALAAARDRGSKEYLAALLSEFGGNVSRAADQAGLERESLHRLMRRYGIAADQFRARRDGEV